MLLRVVLESAYLVPSGPSTWGWGMGVALDEEVRLSGFRLKKTLFLSCLEEVEHAFKFSYF